MEVFPLVPDRTTDDTSAERITSASGEIMSKIFPAIFSPVRPSKTLDINFARFATAIDIFRRNIFTERILTHRSY